MLAKVITLGTFIAAGLLAAVLTLIPLSSGPVGILAVFFLLYVIMVGTLAWGWYGLNWLLRKLMRSTSSRRPIQPMTLQHSYYLASVIALGPVMLLGMNTVSKVGLTDIALITLFVTIGIFYVQKRAK